MPWDSTSDYCPLLKKNTNTVLVKGNRYVSLKVQRLVPKNERYLSSLRMGGPCK